MAKGINMSPTVSIILPLYRVKTWLSQAIASIKNQTFKDFECLCLDDGSGNGMADYARELTQDDFRFKVFEFENSGVAATRNKGVELAQAEFVAFIDQDDAYHPQFLERMLKVANDTTADAVGCIYRLVEETFDVSSVENLITEAIGERLEEPFRHWLDSPKNVTVWTKIYRKSKIKNFRFNPKLFGTDDAAFTCLTYAYLDNIAFLPEQLYYYRSQPQSVTRQNPIRYLLARVTYAADIYPILKDKIPTHAKFILLKILSNSIKLVCKANYTKEEKKEFLAHLITTMKTCKVSSWRWSFHKQLVYWKFRLFLR